MRAPLALHASLRAVRLRSSARLFTINAVSTCKSYSTAPPPTTPAAPPKDKPYYITTPIFYVNAAPHVGHLYTVVLTDILKRWQQLQGRKTLLCTGTDEHGMKIQQAAAAAEMEPKKFCDSGANTFLSLANQAMCMYDTFIRTSGPRHHDAVQYFWQKLQQRDYIYTGKHEGWYSVADETFYPESAIEHTLDPATGRKIVVSRETRRTVEWTSETNYHFRLSAMAPRLLEYYKANPAFVEPDFRYKEVITEVEKGLEDLSISRPRDRLSWGIPVPNDPSQTIYVWLDALINYLTASGYPWTPGQEHVAGWPADAHIVGKDIVKFHAIYWPAFLLALDLPLPKQVFTHAHWTMNHKKMSKSDGNVVNPFYAIQRYGVDTMRYYLAHDGGIRDDGDYSNEMIVSRYKSDLKSGLGNLVNRVCGVNFDLETAIQESTQDVWKMETRDRLMQALASATAEDANELMKQFDIPNALKTIMKLVHETNKYIQHQAPWALKAREQKPEQNKIIFLSAECVRVAGILLRPFMPSKSKEILDQLAVDTKKRSFKYATYGADDSYGVGTKGKKGLVFPPLSE
ncbi:methionyl-tRNA synthetase-like protein [Sphaerosporella brunnea]|uniref:Probable methionine--tRNA ligase, mitochondrial n=1 Tax=Sphaerosporella brunnea TaxID=1250544 RepID=A0A5J5F2X2_9PEZI|nr:methionyl-tRNA synthetase-like protein [Sphaerosporella brunnea]